MIDDLPVLLAQKLEGLPARPGVYLFKDRDGAIIYIGKANSLRARVRSYFQLGNSDERQFLPALVARIVDVETIATQSEKEAVILENSLIKEKQPRFNVKLRDDKEYLTLRLRHDAKWPRLEVVRVPEVDGASYFGPYHSASSARRTLHLVEKQFQLRTCTDRELESRARPCLQHQIKRCKAPCVGLADDDEYRAQVRAVGLFLEGRHGQLSGELRLRMHEAASAQAYELAATYRDQLRGIESVMEKQRVVTIGDKDQDVVGLYREGESLEIAILCLRGGRIVDTFSFSLCGVEVGDQEVVAAFLREQYSAASSARLHPDEILVPILPDGALGIAEWLSEHRSPRQGPPPTTSNRSVRIIAPSRGAKRALLDMAVENAQHAFAEKSRAREGILSRLQKLQRRLHLTALPRRIECTDISHLGGEDTVGSVVAMLDGELDKKNYRTFRVRTVSGGDDYAAMYEVLRRRFSRGKDQKDSQVWSLPDLFVVDGGRGQLAVALSAARELGLDGLQLAGLAKERENVRGDQLVDRVYLPGQKNPIALSAHSPELFLLAQLRDEAHRFANRGRMATGKRSRLQSELDAIVGIGSKSRVALLRHFGSLANLKSASDEEVLSVPGIHRGHLRALRDAWAKQL